ncbi:MAG TPA: hypothetical protein VK908_17610 [Jiangellales bacterium]|jgi:hypothetical protein|nr:hypothetical protein [Jiangellales bacterium]
MSRTPPAPRPALRKAADGSVHPASPHRTSLAVDAGDVGAAAERKGKKGKSAKGRDEPVELSVTLTKAERKRLRRKAEAYGWSAEEAAAHVLRVWADD